MGDSNSKFMEDVEPYSFIETSSHGVDWDDKKVFIIDNEDKLEQAKEALSSSHTIYVDMEGHYFGNLNAEIGLIQIAVSDDLIFLFDTVRCRENLRFVRTLVESENILKVFHDGSGDISALGANTDGNIKASNVFDTQIAQRIIESRGIPDCFPSSKVYPISYLYEKVTRKTFPEINVKSYLSNKWIEKRPLAEDMIKYATTDVMVLQELYYLQLSQMSLEEKLRCFEETERRIKSKTISQPVFASSQPSRPAGRRSQPSSSSRGGLQQAESSGLGTALTIGAVAVGIGALASLLLSGSGKKK